MTEPLTETVLDDAEKLLTELKAKPSRDVPIRDAIQRLRPAIQAAADKGYSWEEILGMLSKIHPKFAVLKVSGLRRYLANPRAKYRAGEQDPTGKGRRRQSDKSGAHVAGKQRRTRTTQAVATATLEGSAPLPALPSTPPAQQDAKPSASARRFEGFQETM